MAIATGLFLEISQKLLKEWEKKLGADDIGVLPTELELAGGIERVATFSEDLKNLLESSSTATTNVLTEVKKAIESVQRRIGELKVDGVLGSRTLSRLGSLLGCPREKSEQKKSLPVGFKPTDNAGQKTDELWFLYFVETLPTTIPNVDQLVEQAWAAWQQVALVRCRRVSKVDQANVIIRNKFIDGSGPILGQAHVGPPSGFVLELEMDAGQHWLPSQFFAALCHEIGHLLGLDHDNVPGRLMSEFIQHGVVGPTAVDAERARLKHGSPPKPMDIPDLPPVAVGEDPALAILRRISNRFP